MITNYFAALIIPPFRPDMRGPSELKRAEAKILKILLKFCFIFHSKTQMVA